MNVQQSYICEVSLNHDFRFIPEVFGIYNINDIEEAAIEEFEKLTGDGLGEKDECQIIEITDHRIRAYINIALKFTKEVIVTAPNDNDWKEDYIGDALNELFPDEDITDYTPTFNGKV